ncbi:MAG: EI24 domain-containing protein [Myxococcota bacterium]|nr:EI24 domain-containing protein [Myxococcota bacterium]
MGILAGPIYLLRASFLLLKNPKLIRLGLIPSLCTLVLSGVGLWLALDYGEFLLTTLWPEPAQDGLHWLWSTVSALVSLSSGLLVIVITPWFVMLFGLPLCEPLSAAVDGLLGGQTKAISLLDSIVDVLRTTLVLTVLGIGGASLFFMLGFVPGVALITTPFVAFVWTPFFAAFNAYDSPMSRRQLSVKQKFSVLLRHPFQAISYGLVAVALLSIPVVNLLGLPLMVIAGVMIVRDLEKKGRLKGKAET